MISRIQLCLFLSGGNYFQADGTARTGQICQCKSVQGVLELKIVDTEEKNQ
jgi:hypothetical protein